MAGWHRVFPAIRRRAGLPGTPVAGRAVAPLATPAGRFRCAVTTGFALTLVGVVSLGTGGSGIADDLFGGLGGLFSGMSATPQYSQPGYGGYAQQPRARRPRTARRRANETKSAVRFASTRHRGENAAGPVRLGRLSMCVRLCDGFAFPVGAYHGEEDRGAHEATCQSECPGARTSLYVLPNGTEALGEAVEVKSGRTYSQMPAAFHYTTFLEESCSCHPRGGNRVASLLHDFTLRRGDAVMTGGGVKVFHGGGHFPYRQGDFVALSKSSDVHDRARAMFHAIDRASRSAPASLVQVAPSQVAPSLPGMAKQASLTP